MKKTEQIRVILEAYSDIPDLQDGWTDVREKLYDMNKQAELRHRRGAPEHVSHGLSVPNAAKLFTVHYLLDGFAQPDRFSVDDILSIRNEVLYAQAYAKKFHKELTEWSAKWTEPFEQVDYAVLMKVGQQ